MDTETKEGIWEEVEFQLGTNSNDPRELLRLYTEFRAAVASSSSPEEKEFWLSACRLANGKLLRLESSRKKGEAFADNELPLRAE
jgi:hypothetical protein